MIKISLYQALHSWVKDTQTGSLLSLMGIASCVINMDIEWVIVDACQGGIQNFI